MAKEVIDAVKAGSKEAEIYHRVATAMNWEGISGLQGPVVTKYEVPSTRNGETGMVVYSGNSDTIGRLRQVAKVGINVANTHNGRNETTVAAGARAAVVAYHNLRSSRPVRV